MDVEIISVEEVTDEWVEKHFPSIHKKKENPNNKDGE